MLLCFDYPGMYVLRVDKSLMYIFRIDNKLETTSLEIYVLD